MMENPQAVPREKLKRVQVLEAIKPRAPENKLSIENEQAIDKRERELLMKLLTEQHGMEPTDVLEFIAHNQKKRRDLNFEELFRAYVESFGIPIETITPEGRRDLLIYFSGMRCSLTEQTKHVIADLMERKFKAALIWKAEKKLEQLQEEAVYESSRKHPEFEKVVGKLREFMQSLQELTKLVPPEKAENTYAWERLLRRFQLFSYEKSRGGILQKAMNTVFSEYHEFIEYEFISRELTRRGHEGEVTYTEDFVQRFYDRTKEEIEEIKQRNRRAVVQEIMRLKDEPYLMKDQLLQLLKINNREIIPLSSAKFRTNVHVTFGNRIGTFPEDVQKEIDLFFARVERFIDESIVHSMSQSQYEIAVAKLHNDLLDIRPFEDRNGSTTLLFMELMMARKGYVPSTQRENHYYHQLRKVLDNNPIAIGLVGHMMYKIKHVPGYFEGETTKAKQDLYGMHSREHHRRREENRAEAKRAKNERRWQRIKDFFKPHTPASDEGDGS